MMEASRGEGLSHNFTVCGWEWPQVAELEAVARAVHSALVVAIDRPPAAALPFELFAAVLSMVERHAVDVEAHPSPLVPYCAALAGNGPPPPGASVLCSAVAEIQRRQREAAEEEGDPAILGVLGGLVAAAGRPGVGGGATRHVGDEDDLAVFSGLRLPTPAQAQATAPVVVRGLLDQEDVARVRAVQAEQLALASGLQHALALNLKTGSPVRSRHTFRPRPSPRPLAISRRSQRVVS